MSSFISNLNRKSEKYGDVHFISFFGAILARLAYLNDNKFLQNYNSIFGPVIQPKILQAINGVNSNNLRLLLDDQTLFGLSRWPNDTFRNFEYQYKGKIKFVKDRPGHDLKYSLNSDKIKKELNWKCETNFNNGIKKTGAIKIIMCVC